jgi:hypothetical protein
MGKKGNKATRARKGFFGKLLGKPTKKQKKKWGV